MNNMTAAEYRKLYDEALDSVVSAEEKRDEQQRLYDVELEIIEASRHGLPGRELDTDNYITHKIKLGNIESRLIKARRLADTRGMIWRGMPTPKPPRKRRTVLVDGIRTKIERETVR
jgi:hypothetical protein